MRSESDAARTSVPSGNLTKRINIHHLVSVRALRSVLSLVHLYYLTLAHILNGENTAEATGLAPSEDANCWVDLISKAQRALFPCLGFDAQACPRLRDTL